MQRRAFAPPGSVSAVHVLLALVDDWDGLAPFLSKRGVDAEAVRNRVESLGSLDPFRRLASPRRRRIRTSGSWLANAFLGHPNPSWHPPPQGIDPHRRRPWGSVPQRDGRTGEAEGGSPSRLHRPRRQPGAHKQGRPVHLLIDDEGGLVLDEEGQPILTAVDVPQGSEVRSHQPRGRR